MKINTETLSNKIARIQDLLEKTQDSIPQENNGQFFTDAEGRHLDRIWDKLSKALDLMEDAQDSILSIDDSRAVRS